jgi:hypothetical protein
MGSKWRSMHSIIRGLIVLCLAGLISNSAYSAHAAGAADSNALDATVDKAMAGYNAGDAKVFFADYAKMMAAVATEGTFNLMYKSQPYGKYVSRTPIKAETVLLGDNPLLVYQAEFEKNKKVKISVNFTKEDGAFKVMQIQIAPM